MTCQRRYISAAFREAKDFLEPNHGICHALGMAYAELLICHVPFRCATHLIRARLGGHIFVEGWLHHEAGVPKALLTRENLLAYRHRWLDALIEEFEK